MRTRFFVVCAMLVALTGATAVAQQAFVPARQGVRSWQSLLPKGRGSDARVIGTVTDITRTPVAYARLVLRDLVSGNVEQEGTSNDKGEYEFSVLDPSTYVVEMISLAGNVVAVSNAGAIGRAETLQTTVQLPGRWESGRSQMVMPQPISNYFGMSAQTSMTAGTLQLAIDQRISTSDAGEPVSPNF